MTRSDVQQYKEYLELFYPDRARVYERLVWAWYASLVGDYALGMKEMTDPEKSLLGFAHRSACSMIN